MSTSLDAPPASANFNSSEPVPLDTIPISPAAPNGTDMDMKENQDPSAGGANAEKDEQITIFHDKDNFNVKHPLIHEWTLWFTKPPSGKVRQHHANKLSKKRKEIKMETQWRELGEVYTATDFKLTTSTVGRQLERSPQRSRHLRFSRGILGRLRQSTAPLSPLTPSLHHVLI